MRAKKSLGQNFLQDESVIVSIVDALALKSSDIVIEIGPGLGALTEKLLERAGSVFAIEFDRNLVKLLRNQFGDKLQIIEGDVLNVNFREIASTGVKLVGNLPYNISTPILQRLIEHHDLFSTLVLMFQREVVDRIDAAPGTSERGYLTVLVEAAFEVERLFDVPPAAFQPIPKVWSAVVRLTPKQAPTDKIFRHLVSVAFAQKRKTILNNLRTHMNDAAGALKNAGIDPQRRAETLTLEEWRRLSDIFSTEKSRVSEDTRLGES